MKVILLENVEHIGKAGDIVDVADGHARNFLFPRGLAAQASAGRMKEAERKRAKAEETARLELEQVEKYVEALDGKTVLIKKKIGPDGALFGAVTVKDIAHEIERALGVQLPKGVVRLKEPLKHVGERPVHLEFPHGLEADVILVVEGGEESSEKERRKETRKSP